MNYYNKKFIITKNTIKNNYYNKKKNINSKKSFKINTNKTGGEQKLLDLLFGSDSKDIDIQTIIHKTDEKEKECFKKKYSNIEKCLDKKCIEKEIGDINFKDFSENELVVLKKENKDLKQKLKDLYLKFNGLELKDHLLYLKKK
jgi:hypothetical protein